MSISQLLVLLINTGLLISASGFGILCLVLFVESVAVLFPQRFQFPPNSGQKSKVTIMMPAHNEELVIASTLKGILPQLKPEDRLVVIADNCTDATAEIARFNGAEVVERFDAVKRGKGYALDFGIRYLESNPPDILILIDADCRVESGAIAQLTNYALGSNRPVQALYLMEKPTNPTSKDAISAFAFKIKNLVRAGGLARLGIPCFLTGTGMAFPWHVIRSVDLASGNIVEDMKLGLDLTISGYKPLLCSQANVTGLLPQQGQAANSQRTRWEHGHIQTIITYVPQMLMAALEQKRIDLLISALDLCVPPLSLFVMMWAGLTSVTITAGILGASWLPSLILGFGGLLMATGIIISWAMFGRSDLPLKQLLSIPLYILWKIPMYFKFLVKRQNTWVRTERDEVKL